MDTSLQVLSPDPVTSYTPFELNLTLSTFFLCPSMVDVQLVAGCMRKVDSGTHRRMMDSSVEDSYSLRMHSEMSRSPSTSMRQLVLSLELLEEGVSSFWIHVLRFVAYM